MYVLLRNGIVVEYIQRDRGNVKVVFRPLNTHSDWELYEQNTLVCWYAQENHRLLGGAWGTDYDGVADVSFLFE